jgi:hypothetical protein
VASERHCQHPGWKAPSISCSTATRNTLTKSQANPWVRSGIMSKCRPKNHAETFRAGSPQVGVFGTPKIGELEEWIEAGKGWSTSWSVPTQRRMGAAQRKRWAAFHADQKRATAKTASWAETVRCSQSDARRKSGQGNSRESCQCERNCGGKGVGRRCRYGPVKWSTDGR